MMKFRNLYVIVSVSFTCFQVIYASRQELRCPECRILVDTKIEDLPPNVLLMRILEGMYYVCNIYCIFYKRKNSIPVQTTHTHKVDICVWSILFRNYCSGCHIIILSVLYVCRTTVPHGLAFIRISTQGTFYAFLNSNQNFEVYLLQTKVWNSQCQVFEYGHAQVFSNLRHTDTTALKLFYCSDMSKC